LSRYLRCLVIVLPAGGFGMVEKSPRVGGKSPVLMRVALREEDITCC